MKNKKLIIILLSLIILIGGILFVNRIYNKPKNQHIRKKNNLAIMVKEDSGEYESSDAIPKGNYVLNEDKTICENNGKVLNYDSTTGKVSFLFVGSDRCSLYFDKIIDNEKPVISKLVVNDTIITATFTDNIELSGYGISISNTVEPSSWTSISGTSYNFSTTISAEGTYYLWVKDTSGNAAKKEFTITLGTSFNNLMIANNTDIFNENGLRYEGIGLFDEEYSSDGTTSAGTKKLLKILDTNNYGGTSGKSWNSEVKNNWSTASLETELNGTYLTSLLGTSNVNSKLSGGITITKWHLGGGYGDNKYGVMTAQKWYEVERPPYSTSGNTQNIYSGNPEYVYEKIGLMYPSDYGYATTGENTTNKSSCRTLTLENWGDCKNNNWIYNSKISNKSEWVISPFNGSITAMQINIGGSLGSSGPLDDWVVTYKYSVRPTFYLDSSMLKIVGGTGTSTEPYHIG